MNARISKTAQQLGQRISNLRRARSYSQETLAERAQISVSFLSMIERGQRLPRVKTVARLADALGVSLSELFVGEAESSIVSSPALPLITYLEGMNLESRDVDALLLVANAMFKAKT